MRTEILNYVIETLNLEGEKVDLVYFNKDNDGDDEETTLYDIIVAFYDEADEVAETMNLCVIRYNKTGKLRFASHHCNQETVYTTQPQKDGVKPRRFVIKPTCKFVSMNIPNELFNDAEALGRYVLEHYQD